MSSLTWLRRTGLPLLYLFAHGLIYSQALLAPAFQLHQTDTAILQSDEFRDDLPCKVTPVKPALRFDLGFHADYSVSIPLKNLAPGGEQLLVWLRITPIADQAGEALMSYRLNVPAMPEDAKGWGSFSGGFVLGPGRYRVDWRMRDRQGRYCSSHWQADAKLAASEKDLPIGLPPNAVAALVEEPRSGRATRVNGGDGDALHVKILLNVAPADAGRASLDRGELEVLGSLVQNIGRQPQFHSFTLVAFNIHTQKIIHRQENVSRIDMRSLKAAIENSDVGTINYRSLLDPRSEAKFIARILTYEPGAGIPQPDVVVVAGPKASMEGKVPLERLKELGEATFPIFYFSYVADPVQNPFRDPIGAALKAYKTSFEYKIIRPRDMGFAISHLMSWVSTRSSSGVQTSRNASPQTEYAGYTAGSRYSSPAKSATP
jgi:hypothetical protein